MRPRALLQRVRYGPRRGRHWVRVVMDREVEAYLGAEQPEGLDAIEVSGSGRSHLPWRSYRSVQFPDFDLLAPTDVGTFDVVICEQVLEHVRDPWQAMRSLAAMGRPGALVLVSTPFLLRVHMEPSDYWRFTADGLHEMVLAAGMEPIATGTWGNAWCAFANRRRWAVYRPVHRVLSRWTLRDDPQYPLVVWVFARVPVSAGATGG